jgi:hypothetical protein
VTAHPNTPPAVRTAGDRAAVGKPPGLL